jgi:hypothetical protein
MSFAPVGHPDNENGRQLMRLECACCQKTGPLKRASMTRKRPSTNAPRMRLLSEDRAAEESEYDDLVPRESRARNPPKNTDFGPGKPSVPDLSSLHSLAYCSDFGSEIVQQR